MKLISGVVAAVLTMVAVNSRGRGRITEGRQT